MEPRMSRVSIAYLATITERRRTVVKDYGSPGESTTGEDTESDTPETFEHHKWRLSQMSPSAFTIMKSIRYMKDGDQSACFTALSSIMDLDYTDKINASAVMEEDGLELLVNMLEVNNLRCRLKTLEVMKSLTKNEKIVAVLVLMGIAPILVSRLIDDAMDEVTLACDVIANVASKRRAARAVRRRGGIPILVSFLEVKKELLIAPEESLNEEEKQILNLAKAAGHALWKLSRYSKVKTELARTGLIPIMSNIILGGKKSLLIPLVGVLCECTSLSWFQLAIETEGLVGRLLCEAEEHDPLVERLCCRTLMQAAHGNENVRHIMRFHDGLRVLVSLLASVDPKDKPLLAAILGAIWKNAIAMENVKIFEDLGVIKLIVQHLNEYDLDVAEAAAGALAELGKRASCREDMVRKGVVMTLAALLARSQKKLLPNVVHVLQQCAKDEKGIKEIEVYDVVRRLWTLLTHPSVVVRVQAARALEPCVRYANDSGELIRSITNSLLLLLQLLKDQDVEFLQAVCHLIAEVALDEENLAVMSEQGVAALLSALILKENFEETKVKKETTVQQSVSGEVTFSLPDIHPPEIKSPTQENRPTSEPKRKLKSKGLLELQRAAAAAVANCCSRADNRQRFGSLGVIPRLVQFVDSKDALLQAQACRALHALAFSAANCVAIHSCGAVQPLLRAIGSRNEMTQLGAAGCMYNLRNLLLRARPQGKNVRKVKFPLSPNSSSFKASLSGFVP